MAADSGTSAARTHVSVRDVVRAWWPLALSWGLMGVEQPAIAAAIARLSDATVHLAAYGGVVFPISLAIEAPVIMLLAASTELSRDAASYRALRGFTHRLGGTLTLLHALVAFTPLAELLLVGVMGVPDDVVGPARLGLMITTPWTWAIAWRRFNQGVLIRFGRSSAVSRGTGLRLAVAAAILGGGLVHGGVPGVVVGCTALSAGVIVEAVYAAAVVRSVVRGPLAAAEGSPVLSGRAFAAFFVPLALMPLVTLVIQPIGSSAIGRMPEALDSLAVWPVIMAVAFVLQAVGIAFNEVVVALIRRPGARASLQRFAVILGTGTTGVLVIMALTPLADLWMSNVAGLSAPLSAVAAGALWLVIPIPGCRAVQSWYQGQMVVARRTRPITEAVLVFFAVCVATLGVGVALQWRGLEVALVGFSVGRVSQTLWLAYRARTTVAPSQAEAVEAGASSAPV